jgi:hypothetical protein
MAVDEDIGAEAQLRKVLIVVGLFGRTGLSRGKVACPLAQGSGPKTFIQ